MDLLMEFASLFPVVLFLVAICLAFVLKWFLEKVINLRIRHLVNLIAAISSLVAIVIPLFLLNLYSEKEYYLSWFFILGIEALLTFFTLEFGNWADRSGFLTKNKAYGLFFLAILLSACKWFRFFVPPFGYYNHVGYYFALFEVSRPLYLVLLILSSLGCLIWGASALAHKKSTSKPIFLAIIIVIIILVLLMSAVYVSYIY